MAASIPNTIHPNAWNNLSKRLSSTDLATLDESLKGEPIQSGLKKAKALMQPYFFSREEIKTARDLLGLPSGEIYCLLTRDSLIGHGGAKWIYRAVALRTGKKAALVSDRSGNLTNAYQEYATYGRFAEISAAPIPNSYYEKPVKKNPTKQRAYYLLERMKGNIWKGIEKKHIDPILLEHRLTITQQTIELLLKMHAGGYIHADAHFSNFLYTKVDDKLIIRLADFGQSFAMIEDGVDHARRDSWQIGLGLSSMFFDMKLPEDDPLTSVIQKLLYADLDPKEHGLTAAYRALEQIINSSGLDTK